MPFIDLLTHILPGIDDGPETMDESVRMARAAAQEGTDTLVATPHLRDVMQGVEEADQRGRVEEVRQLLSDLNARLRKDAAEGGPRVRVLPGMENAITPDLPDYVDDGRTITINNSRFILLAMPFTTFPYFIEDVLTRLRMKRLVPVLARPERNEVLRNDFGRMRDIIESGTLFVVTSGSITGQFGKEAQRAGLRMVQHRLAHAVVSDMHRLEGSRPPGMRRAFRWVERAADEATALRMMEEQPAMVLRGHSPESDMSTPEPDEVGWWHSLLPGFLHGPRRGGPS